MGLTLELQYDKEEDYGGIVDQLQAENVGFGPSNKKQQQQQQQQLILTEM